MTLVRRHLVGVVGLVLALATGIALGAGPLSHERLLPTTATPAPAPSQAEEGLTADELAAEAAQALYGARLEGRSVALVSTPGVDADTLGTLTRGIEEANGSVTAQWKVGRSLVSASDKALVDALGSQLLDQLEGRGAEADASAYVRMGQLLGTAMASRSADGAVPGTEALTIRQSLDGAGLLSHGGTEPRRAPLVLLVLADDLDDFVVGGLVEGLGSRTNGLVVGAPDRGSDLQTVDELGTATTVDGIAGATGRLAAVLALATAGENPGRSYGASGSDGALPLG